MGTVNDFTAPVDFRLPADPPDGLPPDIKAAMADVYNSMQQVFNAFVNNCGIGPQPFSAWSQLSGNSNTLLIGNMHRLYVPAAEAMVFGNACHLFDDGGTLSARMANATNNTRPLIGFNNTFDPVSPGDMCEIILHSGVATIGGLVKGDLYWLSTTDGQLANGAAVAAGNIEQFAGIAIDENHLFFNLNYWIQH